MKEKIMIFIIGILVGAVIATGVFYMYSNSNKTCDCTNQNMQFNGGEPPEMPNGGPREMNGEEPPEKPDGEDRQPPEKPGEEKETNDETQTNE